MYVAGVAAAYWLAPMEPVPQAAAPTAVATTSHGEEVREQIQSLLAQGGCPGWIALAGEPASRWRETAAHQSDVPLVKYPVPVRVASLLREPAPRESGQLLLAQLSPVDDEELISEGEDLLTTSPEVTGTQSDAADAGSPPAEGAAAVTPPAGDAASAKPQAAAPETPPVAPNAQPRGAVEEKIDDLLIEPEEDLLAPGVGGSGDRRLPPARTQSPAVAPPAQAPAQSGIDAPPLPPARAPAGVVAPHSTTGPGAGGSEAKTPAKGDDQSRCEFIAKTLYPAATECRTCHEKIYEEWSISSHAYSAISPMFHKFEQKINDLSNGTIGYFCFRCHSPAGTA